MLIHVAPHSFFEEVFMGQMQVPQAPTGAHRQLKDQGAVNL